MLTELDSRWARTPHLNIPNLLEKTITGRIRKEIRRSEKVNLITKGAASHYRASINTNLFELSNLLRRAYAVRIIADYEPDRKVTRDARGFSLDIETLQAAKNWGNRVSLCAKEILKVWKQLGIV